MPDFEDCASQVADSSRLSVDMLDHLDLEPALDLTGARIQGLHRRLETTAGAGRADHRQVLGAAAERAIQDQERQPAKWSPCRWLTIKVRMRFGSICC